LHRKQHHQLLNSKIALFEIQHLTDIFYSDNVTTFSEASCHAFHYEKFLLTLLIPMTSRDVSRNRSHQYGGVLGRFFYKGINQD